ncbi:hypothetical protein BJ878DRAFT_77405 [Calycina marina]|uniref:Uncharacterized protein n=1 Tax=Calycina marina TaxID=1763456 RepID=A0A9P7ZAZ9_9HELO|nr:hypothetical protein BJ878DRAFT_77405 [Calycina marina]
MATATALQPPSPIIIQPRTITHDSRKEPSKQRPTKKGEPFDPDDLTRRLTAHLLTQKAAQAKRRSQRRSLDRSSTYHHVPTVAAAAFARTTTPDALRQVHRLSQPVLRCLEGLEKQTKLGGGVHAHELMDERVVERERVRLRNQWQGGLMMEVAGAVDGARDVLRKPTRTFREFAHLATTVRKSVHERPRSEGYGDEAPVTLVRARTRSHFGFDRRNNWTQLDDEREQKRGIMERAGLKKRDSMWVMKSKIEKRENEGADSPLPTSKSRKNSFLARFAIIKRQPS